MFKLDIYEWLYTLAVSFQLSGAILLLLKYTFVNIAEGVAEVKKKETHFEHGTLVMGQTQPTEAEYRENIWLNRIAFFSIATGYLLSVWGSINASLRIVIFAWIIIESIFLTTTSYYVSKRLCRRKISICGSEED